MFQNLFLIFSQKIGFDLSCKLSPEETICMKCQILFSGKNINLSFAEFAQCGKGLMTSFIVIICDNVTALLT